MYWLLFGVLATTAFWLYRRIKTMSILSRSGIPGNKPHLIYGNLFDMKGLSMVDKQNLLIKKYGKIVGYYSGTKPIILVAEPDLVKRVQIKDFHNFSYRSKFIRYLHPIPRADGSILIVGGQRWKQIRSLLTPAFSVSKLKAMTPIIDESINQFLDIIAKNSDSGQELNIYDLYQRLTLQILIKTAFGFNIDEKNESNEYFIEGIYKYLETKVNKIVLLIYLCFPEMEYLINFIRSQIEGIYLYFRIHPVRFLRDLSSQMINMKKNINKSNQRNDMLQAMLESELTGEELADIQSEKLIESDQQKEELFTEIVKSSKTKKRHFHLTEDEIKANCITLLAAGYETSSVGLAYATHFLVNHPEVQQRVRQEVIDLYEREGKLDFNTVTKLQYMEWVLNETMRLYPPLVNGSTRECMSDYKYKDITIPKGATVVICTHYLQNDPEYWSESEKFDPMRFSTERGHEINPSSWQPFGGGPRNCIGMRLAYLEMKLTLARLLLKYKFEIGPNTEIGDLSIRYRLFAVVPKNGVFVRVIKIDL